MTLTQMYEEAMAEVRQQIQEELRPQIREEVLQQGKEEGLQQGLQQGKEEGLQQGLQQGKEEGLRQGLQQATLRLINNLLQTRFGEVDEELAAIVKTIASLPSEEFVPLLLQLSREELLVRFQIEEEGESE